MIEIAVLTASLMAGLGAYGLISRRNLAFVVLSLELIFNAAILMLVVFMPLLASGADVVSWSILLLAIGAAEVAFGFAVAVALTRIHGISDILELSELGGKIDRD